MAVKSKIPKIPKSGKSRFRQSPSPIDYAPTPAPTDINGAKWRQRPPAQLSQPKSNPPEISAAAHAISLTLCPCQPRTRPYNIYLQTPNNPPPRNPPPTRPPSQMAVKSKIPKIPKSGKSRFRQSPPPIDYAPTPAPTDINGAKWCHRPPPPNLANPKTIRRKFPPPPTPFP